MFVIKISTVVIRIKFPFLFFLFLVVTFQGFSQHDSSLKITGYVDAYYALSNDSVGVNNFQQFPIISPRNNAIGLNIAQLTAQYSNDHVRAVATFHYGDIPLSAWSQPFNAIQEANAGLRIGKKIWLDAGFFKTHIGAEALLPKDNIASSLSTITFFEPWWQAGVKLSYTANNKWAFCLHILNGYNTFFDNNKAKSIGLTAVYTINDKGSISYFNLIGDESPEGTKGEHLRITNNFVFNYQITQKLKVNMGADCITQQNSALSDSTKMATIFGGLIAIKYQVKPKYNIYGRFDLFTDENGMLSGTIVNSANQLTGLISKGVTIGVEHKPTANSYVRFETRSLMLDNKQKIFRVDGSNVANRLEAMINIGISF